MMKQTKAKHKIITRRTMLSGLAATTALGLYEAHAISNANTTENLEINSYDIPVRDLPTSFQNYKIGLLTDSHLGISVRTEYLAHALEAIFKHNVDILILGGDLIWYAWEWFSDLIAPRRNSELVAMSKTSRPAAIMDIQAKLLSRHSPTDGILAVLGNHDRRFPEDICVRPLAEKGVNFLINKTATITRGKDTITFAGVDDYWRGKPAMPELPNKGVQILITHNPDYILDIALKLPYRFDLALCGHTHGGQVKLPPFGISPLWRVKDKRLLEGFHSFEHIKCFTSRGVGVSGSFNYRIDCNPEVNVFTLKKEE